MPACACSQERFGGIGGICPGWRDEQNGGVVRALYLAPPAVPEEQTTAQNLARVIDENKGVATGVVILIVLMLLCAGCLFHRIYGTFCKKSFTESVPCGGEPGDKNWVDFKGEENQNSGATQNP